jgi:hypothetical protein
MTVGDEPADRLALADWRRRMVELYGDVRERAATDPESAWHHWRTTRDALYRAHPQSPVPAADRAAFRGNYWPYDPSLRFEVDVALADPDGTPDASPIAGLSLPMSTGEALEFTKIGEIRIPFRDRPRTLALFWMAGYTGGIFLPFRDATNGAATYGAGRYLLDTAKGADLGGDLTAGRLVLDFNFAFQPSCAFDPRWSCPLAPPESRLDVAIEAGERLG